jgi:uncharacterized protein
MDSENTESHQHGRLEFQVAAAIKALGPNIHPPIPNPAPLALFAFGLTTALLQVKHTRIGGDSAEELEGVDNVVFGFGLFFGGLLQLIGGLHERARNNVFGYTAFIVYGGFWMSWAASLFLKVIGNDIPVNPHAVQAMLSLMGTFTFVMFLCTFVMNMTISLLFFLLMMTFFLLAGGVNNETVDKVAGWFGMATAVTAYWLGSVELINDVIGGGEDLIPLGHWGANKFRFAGVMHVPGRIHGVTHRRVLMDSSDYRPDNNNARTLARRRKSSLAEQHILKDCGSNNGEIPNKVPRDVEEGAKERY